MLLDFGLYEEEFFSGSFDFALEKINCRKKIELLEGTLETLLDRLEQFLVLLVQLEFSFGFWSLVGFEGGIEYHYLVEGLCYKGSFLWTCLLKLISKPEGNDWLKEQLLQSRPSFQYKFECRTLPSLARK
jgi:hypothetical protein